jgi:hypothetical protein
MEAWKVERNRRTHYLYNEVELRSIDYPRDDAGSSNHAMQRTATRYTITFPMIKTLPLRLALAPGSRS